jgi:hypothetical protein
VAFVLYGTTGKQHDAVVVIVGVVQAGAEGRAVQVGVLHCKDVQQPM